MIEKNECTAICEFWTWFSGVCDKFGEKFENESLIAELDERILNLGPVSWEIGPGFQVDSANSLVIGPGGEKSLLPLARRIVAAAPPCEGWEFYVTKPPKKWQRRFVLLDHGNKEFEVDASNWLYVLVHYPDGRFGIVLEVPELGEIPKELRTVAGELVVDGEIGEAQRIEKIKAIRCVPELNAKYERTKMPIASLACHFEEVLKGSESHER